MCRHYRGRWLEPGDRLFLIQLLFQGVQTMFDGIEAAQQILAGRIVFMLDLDERGERDTALQERSA